MPLLIVPYTFGSNQAASGAAPKGGAAFYTRKKRYMAWLMACLALAILAC